MNENIECYPINEFRHHEKNFRLSNYSNLPHRNEVSFNLHTEDQDSNFISTENEEQTRPFSIMEGIFEYERTIRSMEMELSMAKLRKENLSSVLEQSKSIKIII